MANWANVLSEIQEEIRRGQSAAAQALDTVRRKHLAELFDYTKRNVIAYYSGFLSRPDVQSDINDEDKNALMMAVHGLDRSLGLDLILHTPGGQIAATQSIVTYLHLMFKKDIRAIVPQIAMSAGTMIACACKEIVLAKHSNLGPIDPHVRGIPAYGVVKEFRRAFKETKSDPAKLAVWQPIIGQYRPTFLGQCENAIAWSNDFVRDQLRSVMFKGDPDAAAKAKKIVLALSSYTKNRTHDRHIHVDECKQIGLKVVELEADQKLQDFVVTVHHCYMHLLMNTPTYKITENHAGRAMFKQLLARPA